MSNEKLIRAWKDAKFRSTLKAAELPAHPAGERLVELDEAELRAVWGAQYQYREPTVSEGYVCTVSGEATGGYSCWN